MSHQLPDVQASQPDVTVGLSQVGVTGVEKLVKIARDGKRPLVLMAEFEVFVDLPGGRKGIDMSRNMQVIDEVLEAAVSEPAYRVEDMCGDAAERLLAKHEYTTTAEVSMTAELVVREDTPASGLSTQSTAEIIASATATDEGTREEIGAEVVGMTVCPCSQGMSASRARDVLQDLAVDDDTIEEFLDKVPQPGHSQRGHATLTVETQGSPEVDLMDLIDIARDSMSARIYNLAKRPDEDHMTYHAHANAKFVEDCVRSMAELSLEALDHLGDDAVVHMKQSNDESIHQHNAHAEREVTLGQLRDELDA
ncbi:GTP cyclohydrolase MptA [Haloferax volcanii]|uniref:GTP cyclohydrolase MptA n=2 Tax=Haloferax volcanii TaxID=2246 RepID=MPTA_HALVD|nr:GTP cyclohydrolase MptA [Haloferax volcanii]D4GWJ7.1 RecName: Full=GTP cyclohydrolase MptA; AltName: Full=GTP cyclohydrolase I; Short=GCYH-I; AltName: Full=GTP cyclohydrolase IV [Haloferax volcanii DS2]ADE05034.1 GTP cyclohydrolase MptA [Haloferax volcanii DS2]ELY32791.1 GTP cyclohydrolase [Haloferax volcanii DS2]MBS8120071.1 GTP cyclohydrolase I FolE2 [Haloferax volcanii]MBS8125109.1 GTP cyclohydrolase I FolE2 [Haloferax volcanii]MBS8128978.1 GTP cyclohydrolase I FolE2 [Haloferax volcanii